MSRRRAAIFAACLVSPLAVVGCGKSSTALTRSELIAKADAICKDLNAEREGAKAVAESKLGPTILLLGKHEQAAVTRLRKLRAPGSLSSDWQSILAADQTLAQYTLNYGSYIASHNIVAARIQIRTAGEVQNRMKQTASEDGFKDCAEFA